MTHEDARACEALLRAGDALDSLAMMTAGYDTLAFLVERTIRDRRFASGGPLEAAALVDAAIAAADVASGRPVAGFGSPAAYETIARESLDWFYGANEAGRPLVTPAGACADSLDAAGSASVFRTESTLAYLAAAYALEGREPSVEPPSHEAGTTVVRGF